MAVINFLSGVKLYENYRMKKYNDLVKKLSVLEKAG